METRVLHKKGFTAFLTFTSFTIMTVTGVVLYFTPQGRVAYWVDWHFAGLTKTQWGNIHIISSIAFAAVGIYHLILNWRVFTGYIVDKIRDRLKLKREMWITLAASVIIVLGSIFLFPPFNYVIDLSEYLKDSWIESREFEPPFGHAEQLSLKAFAKRMDIDLNDAVSELKARGIEFSSPEEKLEDIARAHKISPMELYRLIKKFEPSPVVITTYTPEMVDEKFAGTGLGRMALPWVLEDLGVDPSLAEERLKAQDLKVDKNETLKQAAERYGIDPIDILKVILVEDYRIRKEEVK